jgi:hypothetical protein
MNKKAVIDSKLLETIDDQIYKHLPIDKLTKIVEDKVEIAIKRLKINKNLEIISMSKK